MAISTSKKLNIDESIKIAEDSLYNKKLKSFEKLAKIKHVYFKNIVTDIKKELKLKVLFLYRSMKKCLFLKEIQFQ